MDKNFFKGKRITVLGLGLHGGGVGIVRFLSRCGANVLVTDIKSKDELIPSLKKIMDLKNVKYVLGHHRREDFEKADMVIKNPSVPWTNEHVQLALSKGVPVEMDSSLFFKMCRNPIIGITGTKGKTTTASLIFQILKSAGKKAVQIGIGQTSVLDKLDELEKGSVVVFELSSWRLSALGRARMSPQIAVICNILPDHLNYYRGMEEYIADKENIFLYQKPSDFLIINGENKWLKKLEEKVPSRVIKFYSHLADSSEQSVYLDAEAIYVNDGLDIKKIINVKEIKLPGRHNLDNVMAAAGAAIAFGLPASAIKEGIRAFKGIPHRLEFVRELKGVRYYNDTAATIPDALLVALESFENPVILIAGGTDKNLDYSLLGQRIMSLTKEIIFLKGTATQKMISEIKKNQTGRWQERKFQEFDRMEEAVKAAAQIAQPGEVVLLSPGAASFGLFLNEFDRGDKYRQVVMSL